jgi:hypothetical protein
MEAPTTEAKTKDPPIEIGSLIFTFYILPVGHGATPPFIFPYYANPIPQLLTNCALC